MLSFHNQITEKDFLDFTFPYNKYMTKFNQRKNELLILYNIFTLFLMPLIHSFLIRLFYTGTYLRIYRSDKLLQKEHKYYFKESHFELIYNDATVKIENKDISFSVELSKYFCLVANNNRIFIIIKIRQNPDIQNNIRKILKNKYSLKNMDYTRS